MTITISERNDRLDSMIAEGRLVRRTWGKTTYRGQETACLLAALSPECGARGSAAACPAEVMPKWLAHITVWMDDNGSVEAWSAMVRRYAAVARRWHVLTDEDWRRLDYTARRIAVEVAISGIAAGDNVRGWAASAQVAALCRRAEAGDSTTVMEWKAAEATAWAARGARIAARAARAEHVVVDAAETATWSWAAADRMTDAILDAIEAACDRRTAVVS